MFNFQIEVTSLCNSKCYYCYNKDNMSNENNNSISITNLKELIGQINELQEDINVILTGGEPLLAEEQILYISKNINENINIKINTNLTIDTKNLKNILDSFKNHKVSFLVSVPSFKKETYEYITKNDKIFNLIHNLKTIKSYKNINIVINHVISKINCNEIENFLSIMNLLSLTNIRIHKMKLYNNEKSTLLTNDEFFELFLKVLQYKKEKFHNINELISYQAILPCLLNEELVQKNKNIIEFYMKKCGYVCMAGINTFSIQVNYKMQQCSCVKDSDKLLLDLKNIKLKDIIRNNLFLVNSNINLSCKNCIYYENLCIGACNQNSIKPVN